MLTLSAMRSEKLSIRSRRACLAIELESIRLKWSQNRCKWFQINGNGGSMWESNAMPHGVSSTYEKLQGAQRKQREPLEIVTVP